VTPGGGWVDSRDLGRAVFPGRGGGTLWHAGHKCEFRADIHMDNLVGRAGLCGRFAGKPLARS